MGSQRQHIPTHFLELSWPMQHMHRDFGVNCGGMGHLKPIQIGMGGPLECCKRLGEVAG